LCSIVAVPTKRGRRFKQIKVSGGLPAQSLGNAIVAVGAVAYVGVAVVGIAAQTANVPWFVLLFGGIVALFAGASQGRTRTQKASIVVDADGLHCESSDPRGPKDFVRRGSVKRADLVVRKGQTLVHFVHGLGHSTNSTIAFDSVTDARRCLRALGCDLTPGATRELPTTSLVMPSRASAVWPSASMGPALGWIAAMLALAVVLIGKGELALALESAAIGIGAAGFGRQAALLPKSRLRLGADGFNWSWLGRDTSVPRSHIASYKAVGDARNEDGLGVEIVLRTGKRIFLPATSIEERAVLLGELERYEGDSAVDGALLDAVRRRGRTLDEWLVSLRALGGGAATDLRKAHVDVDALERLAIDPNAPPAGRIAAAVALREAAPPGALARVRVAAEGSVTPELREALGRITEADADEEALREALAVAEQETNERQDRAGS
jgi:hypothetical protein